MFRVVKVAAAIVVVSFLGVSASSAATRHDRADKGVKALFFLRSDCPVSNRYAPEIQRIAAEFAGRVDFELVFPDYSDEDANIARDLREYYAQSGLAEKMERDPGHALVKETGVDMMPEAAVLRDGKLVYAGRIDDHVAGLGIWRATASVHDLENAINAALEGRAAQPPGGPAYGCYIADAQ